MTLRNEIIEVLRRYKGNPARKGLINRRINELRKDRGEQLVLGETIGRTLRFMVNEEILIVSYKRGCAFYSLEALYA